jgi:hypothetical protein
MHVDAGLLDSGHSAGLEFDRQRILIDAFEIAIAELSMNFVRCTDNLPGQSFMRVGC